MAKKIKLKKRWIVLFDGFVVPHDFKEAIYGDKHCAGPYKPRYFKKKILPMLLKWKRSKKSNEFVTEKVWMP